MHPPTHQPPTASRPPLCQDANGRVIGARVRDNLGRREQDVYARVVLNATGPFADEIRWAGAVPLGCGKGWQAPGHGLQTWVVTSAARTSARA